MKVSFYTILFFLFSLTACQKKFDAPVPSLSWPLFDAADAVMLKNQTQRAMEGVYRVSNGVDMFGSQVAIKWSYAVENTDTVYHLSVFCGKDIAYFIMQGKRLGDSILMNGYWRKMINTETGIARLTISAANGARQLLSASPVINKDSIIIEGAIGNGQGAPTKSITFQYDRRLYNGSPFEILAHRSGGRTSDLLPVSENSVGMIKFATQLGATGIEIDTRLTKDGVPILYHDNTLNLRLIQKNGLVGPIENYTYDQLYTFVRLLDGEHIPTLQEALYAVVYETGLRFVWLDTKYDNSIQRVRELQQDFLQRAAAIGRKVEIVIGLPGQQQLDQLKQLPDYTSVPSLCELSLSDVKDINARVWAPRWTLGLQNDAVAQVKADGRRAFVWTLDEPQYVDQFINEGNFDGVLSNYASLVAYYYYVKQ